MVLTFGGLPCLDPGEAYRASLVHHTTQQFWGKANSYSCTRGKEPGRGWVLMLKRDYDKLSKNGLHQLRWIDSGTELKLPELMIVEASTINRALATDPSAAVLVTFEDKRRTFQLSSIDAQYNVRIPAPSATASPDIYYTATLNGASAWTWQTMLSDIWGNIPGAGSAPTLPYSPSGTPEGWRFIGVSAWDALHIVLDKIGCTTAYDPIANSFSYVRLGTTQTNLSTVLGALSGRLMLDYNMDQSLTRPDIPATIRVFFHRRELYHGIEKDTPDSGNWELSATVSKDYATSATGAVGGSVLNVWDDLPALFDTSGSNTNSSALQARADEIGANILNILNVSREPFRRIYSGLVTTIVPGSEVSELRWRDYGDVWGLVTEIIQMDATETLQDYVGEHLAPPDFQRASHPVYPRASQLVQVDDGASTTGDKITANGDGLFPGFVVRWIGSYETLEACWIRPLDLESGTSPSETAVCDLRQKDRFHGRLMGSQTSGGSTLPVYLVRGGGEGGVHDVSADNGTTVTIDSGDTLDFNASDQSFATEANSTQSLRGIVNEVEVDGGDSTIKRVNWAVDKSVLQNVTLSGAATAGTTPILVRHGTRNSLEFEASISPVILTGTSDTEGGTSKIAFTPNNPFWTAEDDESPSNTVDVDYGANVIFESVDTNFTVSSNLGEVTITLGKVLPIGSIIMSSKAPVQDNTKWYLNRDGAADTNWALMDGVANSAGEGGSGIVMHTSSGTESSFFVRGLAFTGTPSAASNTAAGRTVNSGDVDNDEVSIEVTVGDHPDHIHQITPNACHGDLAGNTHFDFSSGAAQSTTHQLTSGGGALTLDHTVTVTLGNDQGDTTPTGDEQYWEMTPPHKKLYFFERVA